ncbi:MAG TPA: isochorismatase family cysteine hydrolase [Stellaceae bacterium]|nr:isochorismatase family cysteine hydrolase [Stellaceae bacterium]
MRRQRGRDFAFEDLRPTRTALIVIDLMETYIAGTPCAASIIAPINRLAATMRGAGGLVVWVKPAPIMADDPILGALWGEARTSAMAAETQAGNGGTVWASGLSRDESDVEVVKHAASAFFPGKYDLPETLRERGIDTVLITGVLTNICCESSARDAATLGFRVVMVADANAARSDEEHQSALYNILRNFGDVRTSDDLITVFNQDTE